MPAPVSVMIKALSGETDGELEDAIATIACLVPREIIFRLADHIEDVKEDRSHGGVDVKLNTYNGQVESADFTMRSHWRAVRPKKSDS